MTQGYMLSTLPKIHSNGLNMSRVSVPLWQLRRMRVTAAATMNCEAVQAVSRRAIPTLANDVPERPSIQTSFIRVWTHLLEWSPQYEKRWRIIRHHFSIRKIFLRLPLKHPAESKQQDCLDSADCLNMFQLYKVTGWVSSCHVTGHAMFKLYPSNIYLFIYRFIYLFIYLVN